MRTTIAHTTSSNNSSVSVIDKTRSACLTTLNTLLGDEAPQLIDTPRDANSRKRKLTLIEIHEQNKSQKIEEEEIKFASQRFDATNTGELDELLDELSEADDNDDEDLILDGLLPPRKGPSNSIVQKSDDNNAHSDSIEDCAIVSASQSEADKVAEARIRQQRIVRLKAKYWRKVSPIFHRVSLSVSLMRAVQRASFCNNQLLQSLLLSILPDRLATRCRGHSERIHLQAIAQWIRQRFSQQSAYENSMWSSCSNVRACLLRQLTRVVQSHDERATSIEMLAILFVCVCRAISITARLTYSLRVLPQQPSKLIPRLRLASSCAAISQCPCEHTKIVVRSKFFIKRKNDNISKRDSTASSSGSTITPSESSSQSARRSHRRPATRRRSSRLAKSKIHPTTQNSLQQDVKSSTTSHDGKEDDESEHEDDSLSADDVAVTRRRRSSQPKSSESTKKNSAAISRNAASSLASSSSREWAEVFLTDESRWICVDTHTSELDKRTSFDSKHHRAVHVVSIQSSIIDVTRRYSDAYSKVIVLRQNGDWWETCLQLLNRLCPKHVQSETEIHQREVDEADLAACADAECMPTNISAFRTHPKYCIKSFEKKFELIYPQTPVLGTVGKKDKKQNVYPRANMHVLHTRDRWIRQCREVVDGELPCKSVRSSVMSANPDEDTMLFGIWQTKPWKPAVPINDIVPKTKYGTVELWTPAHLPPHTVHLDYPRILMVARKLKVDAAKAMTGFEIRGCRSVPIHSGIVVCEQFEQSIMKLYWQREAERVEKEKRDRMELLCSLWRCVVKGSIIRHQVHEAHAAKIAHTQSSSGKKSLSFGERSHTHTYPAESRIENTQNGLSILVCSCGHTMEEEEL